MRTARWDDPETFDDTLVLGSGDAPLRRLLSERLSKVRGAEGAGAEGTHPRYRILAVSNGPEALRRAAGASIAAVDLALPKGPGLETIRKLREAHANLAILAFATAAGASDAMAAVMAGADMFYDCKDQSAEAVARAVELAVDRRRLTHAIETNEEALETAKTRLAKLSGDLVGAVPGLWPLRSREDVLPFREAARRYLLMATQHYERDPRGLASALGVSYFALRRLLARYDVAIPAARPRK